MHRIANDALKQLNCHLIKSKETVRAFGKPRNKRSIQAKQHRGKWLWAYSTSEEKMPFRHINVHYNWAFVKNYTCLLFNEASPYLNRGTRIAIDDKAYLHCGTSKGFFRSLHKLLQLSDDTLEFQLPCSDYAKSCGYVSPGVMMTVNRMDCEDNHGDDRHSPADVTVSVACKHKIIYPSDSTNWANDLYANRLKFQDEYELPRSPEQKLLFENVSDNVIKTCIFIRDSLLQFEIMTIQDDYLRLQDRGDHLDREKLRISTLIDRIKLILVYKSDLEKTLKTIYNANASELERLMQKLKNLLSIISSDLTISDQIITGTNHEIIEIARSIRLDMETEHFPKHRAIEVQTFDAGTGVSSHERITQIRLAESFQIHNLDLQARVHFAPNDSRNHTAEKVMCALNEHAGDGTSIPLPTVHLTELESPHILLAMSNCEIEELRRKQETEVALKCANRVAQRY